MPDDPTHSVPGPVARNFALNLMDGAVFGFGASLVARTTVLPLLVSRTGGGNAAIGLIPVLWIAGTTIPQVFSVPWADRAVSRHRFVLKTALMQRLPWLLIALVLFQAERIPPELLTGLILSGFGLAALASGVNSPAWFDFVAHLTPTTLRGRLFGLRAVFGGALGILAGWITAVILDREIWPESFAVLFLGAFLAMVASYVFLILLRDESPDRPRPERRTRESLVRLPGLLAARPNFQRFLLGDAFVLASTISAAFLAVAAFDSLPVSDADIGRFTMVSAGSAMAGAAIMGAVADRIGHRRNMLLAALCSTLACVLVVLAPGMASFYAAFSLAALAEGLRNLSRLPLVAELCGETDRTSYVALSNVATIPCAILGLGAGLFADSFGFDRLFVVAGLAGAAAFVILAAGVREPRHAHNHVDPIP